MSRPMKNETQSFGNTSLMKIRSPVPQVRTCRPNLRSMESVGRTKTLASRRSKIRLLLDEVAVGVALDLDVAPVARGEQVELVSGLADGQVLALVGIVQHAGPDAGLVEAVVLGAELLEELSGPGSFLSCGCSLLWRFVLSRRDQGEGPSEEHRRRECAGSPIIS